MPFELFTPEKALPRGEPMVTITGYGRLALNKSATYRLDKDKVANVQLFFDRETRSVGVKPSEKVKGSFSLTFGTNGNGAGFSCIPFWMYIQYDWKVTRNFAVSWSEENGMYVFSIPEEYLGTVVSGEHIKKKTEGQKP